MHNKNLLKIGTSSWKYDSWIGLIYSEQAKGNYLREYAQHYSTVEIDQWFWSLFPEKAPKLPDSRIAQEYNASVPDTFKFSVKVPNSITLTHYYSHDKEASLKENPYFFSHDVFAEFLDRLSPMRDKLGPILFQFEYLNRQKMSNQGEFLEKLERFLGGCPQGYTYAIEIRNPNYLNKEYFGFLQSHGLGHVFLQGYYMPQIIEIYDKYRDYPADDVTVIRLHGPDRKEMEERTQKRWDKIVSPKDLELQEICRMMKGLVERGVEVYVNVNNHYEGSAPRTIEKIQAIIKE